MRRRPFAPSFGLVTALAGAVSLAGCEIDLERMLDQKKAEPYEASPVFSDGKVMRQPPRGTVPRSAPGAVPPEVASGRGPDGYLTAIPERVDGALLERGEDRYRIFCQPCHAESGDGRSKVADAMRLRRPPSFHEPRIRALPVGAVYRVINEGYGLMPAYAAQLSVRDRWAVVAYLQALQLSGEVALAELPRPLREEAAAWLR